MEENGGELESSLFGYIGIIQYYQLNLFCLMIASADALPVSVQIYLLIITCLMGVPVVVYGMFKLSVLKKNKDRKETKSRETNPGQGKGDTSD